MKMTILPASVLTSFRPELRRLTLCLAVSSSLIVPVAWAGLDEGVQAYKKHDYATALSEFRPLAERGNTDAQYNLGQMYRQGDGVTQNETEAVKWYRLAADKGDADAQYNLGQMYRQGIGVATDHAEAEKWYRLAAKQGYAPAQAKLKPMHEKKNTLRNSAVAAKRDIPVAEKTAPQAEARSAAEQDNAKEQTKLGIAYAIGQGVPQDFNEAMKWFRLAAEQGDADAQYNLGVGYSNGKGVPKDLKLAFYWFEKSATAGKSYAQANLGWAYMSSYLQLASDYDLAMDWNLKASSQGYGEGSANIGLLYENGWGVPANKSAAAGWYKKAIEQGGRSGRAELQLGGLYENGLGVPKDSNAASILYRSIVEKYAPDEIYDEAKRRLAALQNP